MREQGPKPPPIPDVGPPQRGLEKRERAKTGALALLASLSAFLYLYEPPHKIDSGPLHETVTPQKKSKALEKNPVTPTDSEEVARMLTNIHQLWGQILDVQARQSIPMLQPDLDIWKVCRFTSDWMIEQSDNLSILWEYLEKRKSSWPNEIRVDLEKIRTIPPAGLRPETIEAVETMVSSRLKPEQRKPFKCGLGLMLVSSKTQRTLQELGADIIAESLKLIAEDLVAQSPERIGEARKAADAAIIAIRAAFPKKLPNNK